MKLKQPYKIAVSGSAAGDEAELAKDKAMAVGAWIAKRKCILLTGATTGVPQAAAAVANEHGGMVIGFSPAASRKEHTKKFKLPVKDHDIIFYSNFGYAHRNSLLTTLSDAVIVICGRIGTLNEFTTTFEANKLVGVLLGSGGIADEIPRIIDIAKRGGGKIIYDEDPKRLVDRIIAKIEEQESDED